MSKFVPQTNIGPCTQHIILQRNIYRIAKTESDDTKKKILSMCFDLHSKFHDNRAFGWEFQGLLRYRDMSMALIMVSIVCAGSKKYNISQFTYNFDHMYIC